ncbi:MAG: hypothetical protein WBF77_03805 [Sulfurimonadaceae bacterium]
MKFLESFLPKLFITLIPSAEGVHLYGELRKNGKLIKRYDGQVVAGSAALEKIVRKLEQESSLTYIALLETEASQGLLSDCRDAQGVDLSSVDKICVENRWGVYMSKDDLFERQKMYKNVGLDFLFSPFSLLYSFYQERVKESDGLYLLITSDFILSAVFKNTTMLYGKQIMMHDELSLIDGTKLLERYIEKIQATVKDFYDAKVDDTMFIEKIFIADGLNFDTSLENRLEEALFVEVEKQSIDLSHELILLSEKELG